MSGHLFESLQSAARLAVRQEDFDYRNLTPSQVEHWARTYRATLDQVEEAFKIALNGSNKLPEEVAASAPPAIEYDGEGK